ncbi:MAG: ABC transporter substrate-binding protein [Deltaproteobacteria bacterium]|nr:ABC transporter substrate-binding protein [Deltaproteobacteria bacterium]
MKALRAQNPSDDLSTIYRGAEKCSSKLTAPAYFLSVYVLIAIFLRGSIATAQAVKLRASYSSITANNTPIWITREKGFFNKYQLDLQIVLIESGTTSIQALIAGETQIAQLGGGVVLSSGLSGADVVVVARLENRLAFTLIAQKNIKSSDQLRGKRLAISRFGSASDLGARLILQRSGLMPEKEVSILQVGGTSTRLAALTKGNVESAVLTPEFSLLANKSGFTILATPLSVRIDFPQNAIATSRAFLKAQPESVSQFLKAVIEGVHFYKNSREESIRIMGKYLNIQDQEAMGEIYDLYKNIFLPVPFPTVEGMQTLLSWMAQRDPRAAEAKVEQFIDTTTLKEIEKSGFVSRLYPK